MNNLKEYFLIRMRGDRPYVLEVEEKMLALAIITFLSLPYVAELPECTADSTEVECQIEE